jgi:hypothetical protein
MVEALSWELFPNVPQGYGNLSHNFRELLEDSDPVPQEDEGDKSRKPDILE